MLNFRLQKIYLSNLIKSLTSRRAYGQRNIMKVKKDQSGNVVLWAVVLVVGLVIGFAVGRVADNNKTTTPATTTASASPDGDAKAAALRTTLVNLGVSHMQLTDAAIDAALDGSPNATALDNELNANGTSIGAAVGSVYGTSAQQTFDKVWQLHLDDFVKYAVADKSGDTAAKAAALTDIDTNYTHPLAAYLAKANPNLPEATLYTALSGHVNMTAVMIDDHVQGKYADEASQLDQGSSDLANLFSTLSGAIVKQYPAKF
jgi:hypothetical protein